MMISQNFLLYFLGLMAFFLVGYILALMQAKERNEKRKFLSLSSQRSILKGNISEQMAPYLPDFPKDLKASEARFIGDPVDFVVFKGLDNKNISEVVFVEVKTGSSKLNENEISLKQTIDQKQVRYVPHRIITEINLK